MIKKLRRRFIIVNMSILTCVLFGVLTAIFVYMYSSEVRISYELMESILNINERDIGIEKLEKVSQSDEILLDIDIGVEAVALINLQQPNDEQKKYPENYNNYQDWYDDDKDKPFPDEPVEPFPNAPEQNDNNSPLKPADSSVPDDSSNDDSSISENNESSSPDIPANNDVKIPDNDSEIEIEEEQQEYTQKPSSKQTQKSSNTTIVNSSESTEIQTTVKVTTQSHSDLKPHEKNFPDPYRGNVKRAYIMVQFNRNDGIDRIAYQYFDDVDEEEIKVAAEKIINQKSDRGKLTIGDYKLRYMVKDNPRMMNGGCQLLFLDRTLEISTINRMLFIFIILGTVGVVVIFGISVLLANWTVKPVDRAWQQQKQFVADASHELKTPLTVISANTDVILSNENDTVKKQAKWLNYIKEETKRMTKLVNSMLYIAKYDSNEVKFATKQFYLSDILSSICLHFETLVFESGKILETNIEENIYLKGDEDKIKQLINILLDNAMKYSTENGKIKASLLREVKTGKINFVVSNTSGYIDSEKLNRLFDRFYRLDDSRNRKTGGSGLGLNIAKSIVEAHGGTIKAIHENEITSFIVTFL